MNSKNIDVLIVGAGGAGLSAALHAKTTQNNVTILSKTFPTHSQTVQAQGGINAALKENNLSTEKHLEDTLKASRGLGIKNNIKLLCDSGQESIQWLDKIGLPFTRNSNNFIAQRAFGGAQENRTCYSSDYTGLKLIHTLYDNCLKMNINFLNEYLLLNLIKKNNKIIGITALEIQTGVVKEIFAKTIILATGGFCNIYNQFTTNSVSTTGDGIAAALNAGVKLSNMEMVQFHPTAMKENNILISESARAEGGYLVNEQGERFIDELKPRDEVARAIQKQLENGSQVYLDLRHLSIDLINESIPQEKRLAQEFLNIDISKELLPINPAAHYSMGGILTNVSCETNLENLFACGECAQNGVHGANRLGGNSLLEIVTFGKIAGENAAKKAQSISQTNDTQSEQFKKDQNFIHELFNYPNQIDFYEKRSEMGKILFKDIGLFRSDSSMNTVLKQIHQWQNEFISMGIGDKNKIFNKNLVEFLEFNNMLKLAEVITLSAISRTESRGSHYRSDYPLEVESFQKNSIAQLSNDTLDINFEEAL